MLPSEKNSHGAVQVLLVLQQLLYVQSLLHSTARLIEHLFDPLVFLGEAAGAEKHLTEVLSTLEFEFLDPLDLFQFLARRV